MHVLHVLCVCSCSRCACLRCSAQKMIVPLRQASKESQHTAYHEVSSVSLAAQFQVAQLVTKTVAVFDPQQVSGADVPVNKLVGVQIVKRTKQMQRNQQHFRFLKQHD